MVLMMAESWDARLAAHLACLLVEPKGDLLVAHWVFQLVERTASLKVVWREERWVGDLDVMKVGRLVVQMVAPRDVSLVGLTAAYLVEMKVGWLVQRKAVHLADRWAVK